jgi:nucleotide-binding universal stress UspA family protein
MKTIKSILVGTDFSANSAAALDYAQHLASRLNAGIRLVHIYDVPTIPDHPNFMNYMPDLDELQELTLKRLHEFVYDFGNDSPTATMTRQAVKIKCEAYPSFVTDKLIQLSYDPSVDLMVLGATGENGILDKLFGTVAGRVAQGANCPVLLVPRDADFKGFRHLVYASSADSASLRTVRFTLDFAKYFLSTVHFVHIKKPDDLFNDHASEMLFTQIVEKEHPSLTYSINNVNAKTVKEGLTDYVKRNNSDLLILVTHERDFWVNLFHDSVTNAMSWDNPMPLLILHSDEKSQPPV